MRPKKSETRRSLIADRISASGSCMATELADEFKVSIMTIHRDLDELQRRGIVRKFHGGATTQPSSIFESRMSVRLAVEPAKKIAIANYALNFVQSGMSIVLDDSTSAMQMIPGLAERSPLHVSTTFLAGLGRLSELQNTSDICVIAIGGRYDTSHDSFVGIQTIDQISSMRWDACFMSTSSVNGHAIYHQEDHIVGVKRAMMDASTKNYLLVDNSKIDKVALHKLADLNEFELVITDDSANPKVLDEWAQRGVKFEVVTVSKNVI